MPSAFEEFDLTGLRTRSIDDRVSKVDISAFATPHTPAGSVLGLLHSLPDILAGKDIRTVVHRIAGAARAKRPVILAMGAHVVKCGLGTVVGDLIRRGITTTVAVNGAGVIHDAEIALFGQTSEDVYPGLVDGSFGMTRETADFINSAARTAVQQGAGLGETLGKALLDANAPNLDASILASAAKAGIPVTVHVAVGTDVVHMHPSADGACIGESSLRDFRILVAAMSHLSGGVLLNVGSAVILPEVVLKAFAILKNQGCNLSDYLGVNLDFVRQYRSGEQIVTRASAIGGSGLSITGHHELLLPFIAACVIETLEKESAK